eukprot:XP_001704675.1 Hypothetical protein GL50803_24613 [Giardia lamblia ATCC 50803]
MDIMSVFAANLGVIVYACFQLLLTDTANIIGGVTLVRIKELLLVALPADITVLVLPLLSHTTERT